MMNFSSNDNLQVQGLTAQVKSTPGFDKIDADTVGKAWDLSKSKAEDQGIDQNNPLYWDTVTSQAKDALGLQLPNTPKVGSPYDLQKTIVKAPNTSSYSNPNQVQTVAESLKKKVKEEQTSDGFSAVPENAVVPGFGGQTGPEINAESRKRLDLMKSRGFGAQL